METGEKPTRRLMRESRFSDEEEMNKSSDSEETAPLHVRYPDLTDEEDERSLLGWFGMMSPEDRIQSAANIANLAANARRKHPDK